MSEFKGIHEPGINRRTLLALAAAGTIATAATVLGVVSADMPKVHERHEVSGEIIIPAQYLQHLPGATVERGGLRIAHTDFGLIEQDGSEAHPNSPVAIAGAHLQVKGSFAIGATMQDTGEATASIQLYGRPPIIADEFRVERESMRITLSGDSITVNLWDGQGSSPAETKSFGFKPAGTNNLTVVRGNGQLAVRMNGETVGAIAEHGIFETGELWFGADSLGGDWRLDKLVAAELEGGSMQLINTADMEIAGQREPGLQHYANQKRPGFTVGFAGALTPLVADSAYAQAMLNKEQFGGMTTENAFKMQFTQPQEGLYAFQETDALVALAQRHGVAVHGHTLVFAEANPKWFNALPVQMPQDKKRIETIMLDRITALVGRYKHDIASWDVINEPLADYDNFNANGGTLREHKWHQAMGEDYIVTALAAAYQANPNGRYFINEYGLEEDGERWDAFVALLGRVLPKLQAQGVPAGALGVGFQAHVYESGDKIDPAVLRRHIQQLMVMGIMSQVSEMDVYSGDGDAVQGAQYADTLQMCLQEPGCIAWRVWIASDRYNYWKDDEGNINQGQDGLYGADMRPRPAYNSALQAVR